MKCVKKTKRLKIVFGSSKILGAEKRKRIHAFRFGQKDAFAIFQTSPKGRLSPGKKFSGERLKKGCPDDCDSHHA